MRYRHQRQQQPRLRFPGQLRGIRPGAAGLLLAILVLLAGNNRAFGNEDQAVSYHAALESIGLDAMLAQRGFRAGFAAYEQAEFSLARRHWEPVARQGHALSQFYMGMLHDPKSGASPDAPLAFAWYAQAAAQGMPEAQQKLALAYARGEGVGRDMARALDWWLRAARQGNADSQYNLGVIYAVGGDRVPRDIDKAAHWWRQAAIGGDPMAQYNLGALYANGDTGKPDLCQAIHWWRKSKQNGFKQAHAALDTLEQEVGSGHCQSNR